jgi:hypothetical protein
MWEPDFYAPTAPKTAWRQPLPALWRTQPFVVEEMLVDSDGSAPQDFKFYMFGEVALATRRPTQRHSDERRQRWLWY